MLYRVDNAGVSPVADTTARGESLREADLEDWAESSPEILGEDLLLIGRQVEVDAGRDRIDLLALDLEANLVVIELKRDLVGGDADLQAVRYASMVGGWGDEEIRGVAESYWQNTRQDRGTFTKELDDFCDAGYELNATQRIFLAGRNVHPRVATMALWLRQHGIDIRVLSIDLHRDDDRLYLAPRIIIPLPTEGDVAARPEPSPGDKEWKRDGRAWHVEQLAEDGLAILDELIEMVAQVVPEADGPRWAQKNYVAWRFGGRNWLRAYTDNSRQIALMLFGVDHLALEEVAGRLGLPTRDRAGSMEVSRVDAGRSHSHIWVVFKAPEDLDQARTKLRELLNETWERFTGQI